MSIKTKQIKKKVVGDSSELGKNKETVNVWSKMLKL